MRLCFRDVGSNVEIISNPAWRKSPSRLFMQMVYAHFAKINGSADVIQPVYTKDDFWKAMQRFLEQHPTYSPDVNGDTMIVWATLPSKQYYEPGLCLRVKFTPLQAPLATPFNHGRNRSERVSVSSPALSQYSSIDP